MFQKGREKSPFFLLAVDFGYTLLAGMGLFGFIGWWLDQRVGNRVPWLLMGGVALGMAVAFNGLFKRLNLLEKRQKAARRKQDPNDPNTKP